MKTFNQTGGIMKMFLAGVCLTAALTVSARAQSTWTYTPGNIINLSGSTFASPPVTGRVINQEMTTIIQEEDPYEGIPEISVTGTFGFLIGARYGGTDFAQVNQTTGLVSVATYKKDGWGSGVNANITLNRTWDNDTAQSLRFAPYAWPETSRTLIMSGVNTIESGGIIFAGAASIVGGTLKAGDATDHFWIAVNGGASTISSAIIGDKGLNILVDQYNQGLTLSGSNSFTGDIWLRGGGGAWGLVVNNLDALGKSKNVNIMSGSQITFGSAVGSGTFGQNFLMPNEDNLYIDSGSNKITLTGSIATQNGYKEAKFLSPAGGSLTLEGNVVLGQYILTFATAGTVAITGDFNWRYNGGANMSGAVYVKDGGKYTIDSNSTSINANAVINLENNGEVVAGRAALNLTGTINQNGGKLGTITSGTVINFNAATAVYNLNGGVVEVAAGANNSAIISGASGTLNLNGGTIKVSSGNARFMNSGTFVVKEGGAKFDIGANTVLTGSKALAHGGEGRDGGLAKSGAGTLILTGANDYIGNTLVNSGTLKLASNASLLFKMDDNFGINTINNKDNLGTGFVDLSAGGIILNFEDVIASGVNPATSREWHLFAGDFDKYNLGSYGLSFSNMDSWEEDAIGSGLWKWAIDADSYYSFSYDIGLLAFITINNIPEPSTLFLLGAGGVLLAVLRRRK